MSSISIKSPAAIVAPKVDGARSLLEWGGVVAGVVLVAFGVVAIAMGVNGRSTVHNSLRAEKIFFGDAKTDPSVAAKYSLQQVDNGTKARAFAKMMRGHVLEATSGLTYAQMGRFQAAPGAPKSQLTPDGATNNDKLAAIDPKTHQPIANGARNLWVTETALTTALNTSYMAENLALFGIVVGIALFLSGVGFLVLAAGGALRRRVAPA